MIVQQTNIFKRRVKKLHKAKKVALDKAIYQIIEAPEIGEMKTGELSGLRVFKYKFKAHLYLLAYEFIESKLCVILINQGVHENFYRDLKRH